MSQRRRDFKVISLPELGDQGPLYERISDAVARLVQDGTLMPGDAIPSQNELMQAYGVSQATVRQAVLNLTNRGFVVARHGAGVFVLEPRVPVDWLAPWIRTHSPKDMPGDPEYEPILREEIEPPARVASLLALTRPMHRPCDIGGRFYGTEPFLSLGSAAFSE